MQRIIEALSYDSLAAGQRENPQPPWSWSEDGLLLHDNLIYVHPPERRTSFIPSPLSPHLRLLPFLPIRPNLCRLQTPHAQRAPLTVAAIP